MVVDPVPAVAPVSIVSLPLPPEPKIVFISRLDTYFGRVLAQYLSHVTLTDPNHPNENKFNNDIFDITFLDTTCPTGLLKVFGTWHPEIPATPFKPAKKPPELPAVQGICSSNDYADIVKMITAADVCVFNMVDDHGCNGVYQDTVKTINIATRIVDQQKTHKKLILLSTVMT